MPGLKDHHIAQLSSNIANEIRLKYPNIPIPMSLRNIISEAMVRYLISQNLKLDEVKK